MNLTVQMLGKVIGMQIVSINSIKAINSVALPVGTKLSATDTHLIHLNR